MSCSADRSISVKLPKPAVAPIARTADQTSLTILLSDSDSARRDVLRKNLPEGTKLHCTGIDSLVEAAAALQPDVIILGCARPPPEMFNSVHDISRARPVPVLMFVDDPDPILAREALRTGVSAYVVDGLTPVRVMPLIGIAIERFRMVDALHRELQKSREDLAARKSIERAKGLLMERRGLSERDAYEAMRRMAMEKARPLKDIADAILNDSGFLP